jgi:hypothetical protein
MTAIVRASKERGRRLSMKWSAGLAIAVVCLAGCQTPRGPSDPFLRTTVPPPQTGQFAPPPALYYQPGVAATPGVAPAYGGAATPTVPAYSAPAANYVAPPPATYGAPPAATPDSMPATPSSTTPANRYAPPGQFNYPQSSIDRAKAVSPSLAAGQGTGPTLARNPAARSRLVGGPQGGSPATGTAMASNQDPGAVSDPSGQSATAAPAVAIVPPLTASGVQQALYVQAAGDADAAGDSSTSAAPTIRMVASDAPDSRFSGAAAGESVDDGAGAADADGARSSNGAQLSDSAQLPSGAAAAIAPPTAIASASVPEITDLPAATGSDTLRAYGTSRSRLVFTRANRPVSPSSTAVSAAKETGGGATAADGVPSVARAAGARRSSYAVADNYGTLYGKLEYSQARRQWKLRYIPIDGQTDNYGGSVLLSDANAVENFHPGDFVVVRGQVDSAGSKQGFSPGYDVRQIAAQ